MSETSTPGTALKLVCPGCGFSATIDAKAEGEKAAEKLTDVEMANRARTVARLFIADLVPFPFIPRAEAFLSRISDERATVFAQIAMSVFLTGKAPGE